MPPSLPKSAVPLIPTSRLPKPCGKCGRRTITARPARSLRFRALAEGLKPGETGVFLETAHPAKFKDTVEKIIGEAVEIPAKLQAFMRGEKKSLPMSKDFADFKQYLMHV